MLQILYRDPHIVVCVKPAGVVSQDAGGDSLPGLLRPQLQTEYIGVVHRLDREVGGVMVYALTPSAAAALSKAVQEHRFEKRYLAVLCGAPVSPEGILEDLLYHDKGKNKTYVVTRLRGGVKPAKLEYAVQEMAEGRSIAEVLLHTGRTHQIRVQFASRRLPLAGDRKYGGPAGPMGLWSYSLSFLHPVTGEPMTFRQYPPAAEPWLNFSSLGADHEPC